MTRAEHNALHGTAYHLEDQVPPTESDWRCANCLLERPHCWLEHDRSIAHWEAGNVVLEPVKA